MWVYIETEPGVFSVGFFMPAGEYHTTIEYATEAAAAKRVHYLNGGDYFKEDET